MSDYEYHEFCRLHEPLTPAIKSAMNKLSSRAVIGTHTASYTYNYSSFRGDPEKLLAKYFDVYYFLTNYGHSRLILKFQADKVNWTELKKESEDYIIKCTKKGKYVYVDLDISAEEAGGWTDGEGWLGDILPIYNEIVDGNYQVFRIAKAISMNFEGDPIKLPAKSKMSMAQKSLLEAINYQ